MALLAFFLSAYSISVVLSICHSLEPPLPFLVFLEKFLVLVDEDYNSVESGLALIQSVEE